MADKNKVAVISGATSGIGRALAEKFKADGYVVCNLARSCDGEGDNYKCDVTDEAQVNAVVDNIAEKYGHIDILINNAGVGISGATELLPIADIKRVIDVSYYGALYLTRACLKHMTSGARIIFMSSISALTVTPFHSVYCSAKAAEQMLGLSLRMELSHTGIEVVCICPGEIKTGFSSNRLADVTTNERYGDRPAAALRHVAEKESKRMPVDKAAKKIYALCLRGKKPIYIIGGKYKFFNFARKVLPTGAFLKCTGGAVKGITVAESCGDKGFDNQVLAACKKVRRITGLSASFLEDYASVDIRVDVE